MNWPPPGFDLSLSEKLQSAWEDENTSERRILAIDRDLNMLRDQKEKRAAQGFSSEDLVPHLGQLIASARKLNQPSYVIQASLLLAEILLDANRPADALAHLTIGRSAWAAAIEKEQAPERATDIQFLKRMAQAHFIMKDYSAVSAVCGEAIHMIELDRYKISAPYLQSAFLKDVASVYKHGVGAAYKLGDYETMLARAELAKSRSILRYSPGNASTPLDPSHERRFRELCDEIRANDPAGNARPDAVEALKGLIEERRRMWDLLMIARLHPHGGRAVQAPAFSLRSIRDSLGADEAILYYYGLDENVLFVSYISREQLLVEPAKISASGRQSLKNVLSGIRYQGSMGDTEQRKFDRAIQGCSFLLPGAFRPLLEGKRRLLVSPHQKLHLFPFHALPWKKGFLIEEFAISYLPNLTILEPPRHPPRELRVLLANPGPYDPVLQIRELPETGPEVKGAAEAYWRKGIETDVLSGAQFTRNLLRDWSDTGRLASYSSIHLATHGVSVFAEESLNTPMESRLFLAASALDGLEISRLRLDADLVVLSACNSGQRAIQGRAMEELPSDEIFGLQAAFAIAGVRSVLGCLWPVDDRTARDIMVCFHQYHADDLKPEAALQAAMVEHVRSQSDRSCHRWAPFFLTIFGRGA
jgi:CHAT domain-containing protein